MTHTSKKDSIITDILTLWFCRTRVVQVPYHDPRTVRKSWTWSKTRACFSRFWLWFWRGFGKLGERLDSFWTIVSWVCILSGKCWKVRWWCLRLCMVPLWVSCPNQYNQLLEMVTIKNLLKFNGWKFIKDWKTWTNLIYLSKFVKWI